MLIVLSTIELIVTLCLTVAFVWPDKRQEPDYARLEEKVRASFAVSNLWHSARARAPMDVCVRRLDARTFSRQVPLMSTQLLKRPSLVMQVSIGDAHLMCVGGL